MTAQPGRQIDPTDIPTVCPAALRLALMLGAESTTTRLSDAVSDAALARVEADLWRAGPPSADRTAVMLRLKALGSALSGRRFAALLARADDRLLATALAAAASMRLNAHAGLNPVRLMWALTVRSAPVAMLPTRATQRPEPEPMALAA